MSIINSFIFDNKDEIVYDASKVEVITSIDDASSYNPFPTGYSGVLDNIFAFVASGQPWQAFGPNTFTFDFNSPRKLKSLTIQQDPNAYAIWYQIMGGVNNYTDYTLAQVFNSANSGDIYHLFPNSLELRYLRIDIVAVPEFQPTYTLIGISGEANAPFVESFITRSNIETLTASSNVEPIENIYDSNDQTFWQSNNSLPQEILFKFRNTKNLSKFEYQAEDNTTYPTSYTLSTSLDNETYYQIVSSGSITNLSGSVDLNPTQTANYLKLRYTGSASNKVRVRDVRLYEKSFAQLDINEIKLKKTVSDAMLSTLSIAPSSQNGINVVSNLVHGTNGDWISNSSMIAETSPSWFFAGSESLTLSFSNKTTVDSIILKGYYIPEMDMLDGVPIDFEIQGSNDNNAFDTIRAFTGNLQETMIIDFDDTEHYEYKVYRILFTKSTSQYIRLSELNFNIRTYPTQSTVALPSIMIDKLSNTGVTTSDVDNVNRDIKFMLNIDNRNFWFNGIDFIQSNGTFMQANPIGDFSSNLTALTLKQNSKVGLSAILTSNGLGTPILNSASMTSQNLANPAFEAKGQIRVRGYIGGHVDKPLQLTMSLRRPIKVDGQIIAYTANVINSDNQGYFDFTLPVTENAVPAKEKFILVVQPINYRVERYTPNQSNIDLAEWLGGNF